MLARKETLFLIVDGVDELGEAKRVQLLEGRKSLVVLARARSDFRRPV